MSFLFKIISKKLAQYKKVTYICKININRDYMYLDNVLIKLRRQYKKDEVIMFALNSIKELKNELQEQKNELSKYKEYLKKEKVENQTLKNRDTLLCEEIDSLKNALKRNSKKFRDLTSIKL